MANEGPDTVSKEAHDRVAHERDQLRAELETTKTALRDLGIERLAVDHLRGKNVDDPMKWANLSLPHLREATPEDIPGKLDEMYASLYKEATPPGEQPPAPPQQPPSPFNQPNPAAPGGGSPPSEAIKVGTDEWKEVLRTEGIEGMKRLDREGKVQWSSENRQAQGLNPRR